MKHDGEEQYHYRRKSKYLKQLRRLFVSVREVLPAHIDPSLVEGVIRDTKMEFESVLKTLPYIGGDGHALNFSYVASAAGLACIRVLERLGLASDAIGRILYDSYDHAFSSLPGPVKALLRWKEFSFFQKRKLMAFARKSQLRTYPGDWVMEYVKGDGGSFDYGTDYTECAVLKLFRQMGAVKYMPYVCVGDLAASRALRTGLHRTTTLNFGGPCCDFRFTKNAEAMPGLPLEELPEYRNRRA